MVRSNEIIVICKPFLYFSSAKSIWQIWTTNPPTTARGPVQLHRLHRLKAGPGHTHTFLLKTLNSTCYDQWRLVTVIRGAAASPHKDFIKTSTFSSTAWTVMTCDSFLSANQLW